MSRLTAPAGTIAQRLALRVAQTPQAIAFQQERLGGGWSAVDWASFADRVASVRRGLAAAGLARGDRLALIAPVSLDWEVVHHAALSLGVALVGLDAHDLPARVAAMAEQADVTAFATTEPRALSALSEAQLGRLRLLVTMGEGPGDWPAAAQRLSLTDLAALGALATEPEPAQPDDIATILFTSGTTGAPKGIAYTHAQLCLALDVICQAFSFVRDDGRLLCWLPLSNLFQRMVNLAAMNNRATTYLLADPRQVMAAVAEVGPDIFVGVPRFFDKLHAGLQAQVAALPAPQRLLVRWAWDIGRRMSRCRQAGHTGSPGLRLAHRLADRLVLRRLRAVMGPRLRCMVTGSAPMSLAVLQDFDALGWLVLEAYGLSENVVPMAMNRIDAYRFGTVGRPLPGNEITIGDDGMVRVRGPGLFRGYLGEADGAARDAQGYYATGDLGALDADGFLRLTGRLGDLIKTSTGRRVAPAGVEAVLRGAPGVDQAVLLGAGRKVLVALCSCTPGSLDGAALPALQAALREAVAGLNPHERPAGIALLEQPFTIEAGELTSNLKLRRSEIERRHAQRLDQLCDRIDAQRGGADPLVILAPGDAH